MVSHRVGDILHGNLSGRFHEKRHPVTEILAGDVVVVGRGRFGDGLAVLLVGELAVAEDVECAPSPCVAASDGAEISRAVGCAEVEVLVLAVKVALLPRERDHVRGIETVLRIVQRECLDACLVGVRADVAVRNPHSHPHESLADVLSVLHLAAFADEIHYPGLVLVRYRECLTFGRVAIFIGQIHDDLDGLPCRAGSLQCDVDE